MTPVAGASGTGGATYAHPGRATSNRPTRSAWRPNTSLAGVDESDPSRRPASRRTSSPASCSSCRPSPRPTTGRQLADYLTRSRTVPAYQDRATAADRGDDAAAAELEATIDRRGRRRQSGEEVRLRGLRRPLADRRLLGRRRVDHDRREPRTTDTGDGTVDPDDDGPGRDRTHPTTAAEAPTAPTDGGGAAPPPRRRPRRHRRHRRLKP